MSNFINIIVCTVQHWDILMIKFDPTHSFVMFSSMNRLPIWRFYYFVSNLAGCRRIKVYSDTEEVTTRNWRSVIYWDSMDTHTRPDHKCKQFVDFNILCDSRKHMQRVMERIWPKIWTTRVILTFWPGNDTRHMVPSWVVFVPPMNIIHEIGNKV